jgi:hypothetical protein
MSSSSDLANPNVTKLHLGEFASRFRSEAIAIGNRFSYFAAALPVSEEEIKDYLEDPIASLPLAVIALVPKTFVLLVPYLEKPPVSGKTHRANGLPKPFLAEDTLVVMDPPLAEKKVYQALFSHQKQATLAFGIKDLEMADYHYHFFHSIATVALPHLPSDLSSRFLTLVREELKNRVHGEVDEQSWQAKQALQRRGSGVRSENKQFLEYASLSITDTLTLYLHGICCDIDVEPGPRQIASRYLRKRLQLLQEFFPPPEGYYVFPEDLKQP